MAWTVNLSNSQLNNLVSGALADGSYTYQEMLDLLSTVAAGGVTADPAITDRAVCCAGSQESDIVISL